VRLGTQVQPNADRKKALLLTVDKSVTRSIANAKHANPPSHERDQALFLPWATTDGANRHEMHSRTVQSVLRVAATGGGGAAETAEAHWAQTGRQAAADSISIPGVHCRAHSIAPCSVMQHSNTMSAVRRATNNMHTTHVKHCLGKDAADLPARNQDVVRPFDLRPHLVPAHCGEVGLTWYSPVLNGTPGRIDWAHGGRSSDRMR
jgi:hypothetical protein